MDIQRRDWESDLGSAVHSAEEVLLCYLFPFHFAASNSSTFNITKSERKDEIFLHFLFIFKDFWYIFHVMYVQCPGVKNKPFYMNLQTQMPGTDYTLPCHYSAPSSLPPLPFHSPWAQNIPLIFVTLKVHPILVWIATSYSSLIAQFITLKNLSVEMAPETTRFNPITFPSTHFAWHLHHSSCPCYR